MLIFHLVNLTDLALRDFLPLYTTSLFGKLSCNRLVYLQSIALGTNLDLYKSFDTFKSQKCPRQIALLGEKRLRADYSTSIQRRCKFGFCKHPKELHRNSGLHVSTTTICIGYPVENFMGPCAQSNILNLDLQNNLV